ncbi:probable G-protein coupled receptor 179 [Phaenicophaeus curvirostris]|uniref:probable G-protein coupled receptor 179 n=1 Tax=Phaenicophaeus curvirostris TaxID=33595 RepID=UPI0037F0A572
MGPWRTLLLLWCLQAALSRVSILAGAQRPPESPVRPAGWSPAPSSSWAPTPEPGGDPEEGSAVSALAFLETGDAQGLARANCSRSVAARVAGAVPPAALRAALRAAPEALAHAANFLNMLFQSNDIREASVGEDVEWYQALARSLVEGHPWARRAVLALDAHPLAAKPRLMLEATKGDGEILLRDVSAAAPHLADLSWDNEWFNALKSQRNPALRKRVLSNDLRSMETPKWQRGDSYVGDSGHVRWSSPFLECRDGRFLPTWSVTLSSAFYGLKPDLSPEFKGVVRVDIDLRDVAIDQCASGTGWFADTHRCDLNSTQCVPQESHGFVLGRYLCRCKPGFYGVGGAASGARAGAADGGSRLACRPCRPGCFTCEDDAPCLIQEDQALRAAVLSCQACCMLAVFLSMLVSYHFRRSKRIRASGVVLLETILFGSLLLYFPVFILYFKPSIFRCIVLRWVRMLGFAIVYGTITLKLYRVLKVFLSRTAQRVPYVSSGRVLKMLGLILLLVLWFLAAWTIGMLENIDKNIPLVIRTQTSHGLHFYICGHDRWDYMMVIAEMLFLLWGSFLCYAMRAVPSAFHEPRYMGIALHNELMISTAFHVVRFVMVPSLHPDWTLLLFFAHTHGTITMTLALLFIPKFLHAGSPLREEIAAEVYEDELDMRHSGSCLNSSIASAWSEHSLDPDDIREELKKLYRQLEVHKTWSMAANNPHLPKKRGSRRSLGRSIVHRIAELPEAVARRSSRGERPGTPARRSSEAKRVPNAGGTSLRLREDGARHRAAALPKSHSTEGPGREPRGGSPALGIPGEPEVTASEQSDSESLDAVPLVCKSASAHDLARHEQPPPPLHKSLSVVAGARDEALLAASRAAREKQHRDLLLLSEPPREAGKLQSPRAAGVPRAESPSPAEGGSQEVASPLGDGKVQKHVTYAPTKSVSVDGSHVPGRVRVAVKRTPPPPPIRCQSLGQRAVPAGDSPEPPTDPLARVAEPEKPPEGPGEEDSGSTSSPVGKGRLLTSIPAQVCPWELVQEEILSRKQKATEAADSGTPGDAAAEGPSLKPAPQKTSLRGLGLALKAFNRSRGKSILKGKRESEGSLGKQERGSRRERPSLAETAAPSLGGISRESSSKSPEWSWQRPRSEPTVPCQHNNNAGSTGEAAGWGDSGAAGQQDSPAPGSGDGEKPAEELSAPGAPLGVHKIAPSVGHQEGAEHPQEAPAVADSGETQIHPLQETGRDVPAGIARLIAPKEGMVELAKGLKGSSSSIHHPWDQAEVEQPGAEACPQGAPGIPTGKGALLRQEAIASQEDSGVPGGKESPGKASSQPEPLSALGGWGAKRVPSRSRSMETAPSALGIGGSAEGRQGEVCPGEIQADSSLKPEICRWEEGRGERWGPGKGRREGVCGEKNGMEKPPAEPQEVPKAALEKAGSAGGRRAEVCPWESEEGTVRAEICPWDAEEAQLEQGRQEGEGRQLDKWGRRSGARSLGLLRGQESRSSEGLASKPAPKSSRLPEGTSKVDSKTSRSMESIKEEICPWESPGMEQHPEHPRARSPALPKSPSEKPQREESQKAEICPWEIEEVESTDKAEICPWEVAAPPSGKGTSREDKAGLSTGSRSISTGQIILEKSGESISAKKEGGSRDRESICPWESPGTEQHAECPHARSPTHPKSPSSKSQSEESRKAEVCPWEAPELESKDKAEICPWEVVAAPIDQPKAQQGPGDAPKAEKRITRQAALASPARSLEKGSSEREAVCPWESLEQHPEKPHTGSPEHPKPPSEKCQSEESRKAEVCPWEAPELKSKDKAEICPWESPSTEQHPEHPRARSSVLSKSPSSKSQSKESQKAEVCPWEAPELESTDKAEICPWEVAAPPSGKGTSREDKAGLSTRSRSTSTGQIILEKSGESISAKKEGGSRDRESICPWESPGTEQHPRKPHTGSQEHPKPPSEKPQSEESRKAEVCPWEAAELESMDKAEICPWESPSTEQHPEHPRTRSPVLPKSPSKKSQSEESRKAEVCPWEAPELKSKDKAEICPWEVVAAPIDQPKAQQGPGDAPKAEKRITRQAALASPARSLEKGSSEREAVCPWESLEQHPEKPHTGSPEHPKPPSEKCQSEESRKAEVCPWEAPELKSKDKAEICPWESPSTEQHPEHPRARSSVLSKSPSSKSQSEESRKAEICPWEAPELESTDKAEICPWEVAAPPSGKGTSRKDKPGLPIGSRSTSTGQIILKKSGESTSAKKDGGSRDRESICPWESPGTEQHPECPHARSPTHPKSPSSKSQSEESQKAEVCPWEAPEIESMDKAEICPWEVAAPPSSKGTSREDKAGLSTGSRSPSTGQGLGKEAGESTSGKKEGASGDCESICPWESPGTEQPSLKSVMRKEPSQKSDSAERSRADICPWEAAEPSGSEKESFKPGVQPRGADRASPAAPGQSKLVAGASTVSPTLLEKSKGRSDSEAKHKPLCRMQPPQGQRAEPLLLGASAGSSASRDEVCPWETEEASPAIAKTSTDPRSTSQVCPWEVESGDTTLTLCEQGRARASSEDGGSGMKESKPDVCPWDHE